MQTLNSWDFEKVIDYKFNNGKLLERALTHSSFVPQGKDRPLHNNERLEFLGDAFLDAIVAVELCRLMPTVPEGVLTKIRAKVVCEKSLAEVGREMKIGDYMRLSSGEIASGGREKPSIIADAIEAVIGAIFIDSGYEEAERFVLRIMSEHIKLAVAGKLINDYKTEIQERVPANLHGELKYELVREEGPEHDKVFFSELRFCGKLIGSGTGKTKKEAEMNAAKEAVERGESLVL